MKGSLSCLQHQLLWFLTAVRVLRVVGEGRREGVASPNGCI